MKLPSFGQVVARLHPHPSFSIEREETGRRGRSARLRILGAAVAMTATVCLAGYWEFEQVDSGSIGSYVAIDKMSDGTIWLAYVNRDSAIRLAHKDIVWEYEDLDTALVRPDLQSWPPVSFDIGSGDVIGVVGLGRLAEHRDSGWSSEQLPMPMRDLALSYDSACRPSLTFKDTLWQGCLALKTDSGWDTNVVFIPSGNTMWFMFTRPAWHGHGDCAFLEADWWSMGGLIDGYGVGLFVRDSGVWTSYAMVLGLDGGGSGFAALVDSSDSIHTFWAAYDPYGTNKLVCDGAWTDYFASVASACLDNLDRMQCVWVRGDTLKYVLPHEPPLIIRIVDGIVWCDITTDTLSEPVIAFCRNDGSIWVAHGIGIVGLSEEQGGPAVRSLPRAVTIVSGVLYLPPALGVEREASSVLLDISGRKVLDLRHGANDISRLAPGVYFVRSGPSAVSRAPAAVTKIVVTR